MGKTRKAARRPRPMRMAHPAYPMTNDKRTYSRIDQSDIMVMVNKLDQLLREVPQFYNPTSAYEATEHHHRASELVAFMRDHDVVEVLSQLAGGELVVVADHAPAEDGPVTDEELIRLRDGLAKLPARAEMDRRATASVNVHTVADAIERTRQLYSGVRDPNRCQVCGRLVATWRDGRLRPHGPREQPCAGSGATGMAKREASPVPDLPVRTVLR